MILLSFDVEEFDLPLEYNNHINFEKQIAISTAGTLKVLSILKQCNVKATFFVTANYAESKPDIIKLIVEEGHELASHGYYHSNFKIEHLQTSKLLLEKISGHKVLGFRMPRMMQIPAVELVNCGYTYNSSLNPTWIPGRYNHLKSKRTIHLEEGIIQVPTSVTPHIRFPLFWLSFHILPMSLIKYLSLKCYQHDRYLNVYFHPWEFTDISGLMLPNYITNNSGEIFAQRIEGFIKWAQEIKMEFSRINDFLIK